MNPTQRLSSVRPVRGASWSMAWAVAAVCGVVVAVVASRAGAEDAVDFTRQVRPILATHCFQCHGDEKQESGLRLDQAASLAAGGNTGAALVAGKAAESLLVQAISGAADVSKMPPEGPPLSAAEIELVRRWVDQGAKLPDEPRATAGRRASDHWSFQPLALPAPPETSPERRAWLRNPIDAFIDAPLAANKLTPSVEAPRATLIRRLTLDLTGLLPSVAEVDRFVSDPGEDAYERLVDRLLVSPHYGERWGRHWLDVARYADSNGYTIDGGRSIWKYRDWVIESFNRDLPFDQFTIEQLAGDLLSDARIDQLIATGFHRNTMVNEEGGTDSEQFRVEAVVDRVSTTGGAFLGLSLGCARCHDHKYDPITQREFYQLFAIFNDADEPVLSVPTDQQAKELPALVAEIEQSEKRLADVELNANGRQREWERTLTDEGRAQLEPPVRYAIAVAAADRTEAHNEVIRLAYQKIDPERVPLAAQIDALKDRQKQMTKAVTTTMIVRAREQPRTTHIHVRGDFLRAGAVVLPNVPEVLPPLVARAERPDRLDFARWLVGRDHPLTARVTVNRVWQTYFGRGLVATENDFGLEGERPSHPELLDWLARRFVEGGWSLKSLHRWIVTSATYRQSSGARADLAAIDPGNKLLGRQQRMRVEAETIRDASLVASGMLTAEIGGPGVYPPQPEGIYRFTQQVKFWGENKDAQRYRRGLYTYFWRSSPYPFLKTFDAPDATLACTRRPRSNTPLQALTLANDRAFFEIAQGFADHLLAQPAADDAARLRLAFRRALAREPADHELAALADFLNAEKRQASVATSSEDASVAEACRASWTRVARVILNLDEFVTRE
jgi:mono/diheme cytochrome c family protein